MDISNPYCDSWLTVGPRGLNVVVESILANLVRRPHLTEDVIGGPDRNFEFHLISESRWQGFPEHWR
jgi:hypothetical protein